SHGTVEHVAPGVAAELVASRMGFTFSLAVLLPGVSGVVVRVAVELDREVVLRPAAVHPAAARRTVRLRQRQGGFFEALDELLLELAEEDLHVSAQHRPELR